MAVLLNNETPPLGKIFQILCNESFGKLVVLSTGFIIYTPQPSIGTVKSTFGLLLILIDFDSVSIQPLTV